MKVRIIQSFIETAAGFGAAFRTKDVVTVPDDKLAKKWIRLGWAVSLEPETPVQSAVQKFKKSISK